MDFRLEELSLDFYLFLLSYYNYNNSYYYY